MPEPTRPSGRSPGWSPLPPDVLLNGRGIGPFDPAARYQASEAISLAFVTALQLLPPRQRTVLILRDVLGCHAAEAAEMLDTSVKSVTSALNHARATLETRLGTTGEPDRPPAPGSPAEQELRLTSRPGIRAWRRRRVGSPSSPTT